MKAPGFAGGWLPEFAGRLEIEYLEGLALSDLLDRVRRLPKDCVVMYLSMFRDGAGETFRAPDVAEEISAAASVPVYGLFETYIGRGVVGGHVNSFKAVGIETGNQVLSMLRSERVRAIAEPPGATMVDWRQMRRWDLDHTLLPPGSEIRFRQPSIWDLYKWHVVASIALIALQTALIARLVMSGRRRRLAEQARRQMELEAEQRRNELAHLSRLAMLGELSGALAHELNQPLTAILSNAQAAQRFLAQGTGTVDEVREILTDIVEDDRRAGEVIRRLRAFLKKEEILHQPVDVNEILLDALRLMRSDLMNRSVTVNTQLSGGLPPVKGDRVQLQQVLLNLIMNACDAMSANADGDRQIVVRTSTVDSVGVEVAIVDRGCGVPTANLERIFEPFVTTKRQGLGLGLAVCRTIVTSHGGQIRSANNVDRGATFRLILPGHSS